MVSIALIVILFGLCNDESVLSSIDRLLEKAEWARQLFNIQIDLLQSVDFILQLDFSPLDHALQLGAIVFNQVESHADSRSHLRLVPRCNPVFLIEGEFELVQLFKRKLLLKNFAVAHLCFYCESEWLLLKLDRKPKLLIKKTGRTWFCRGSLGCKRLLGVHVE